MHAVSEKLGTEVCRVRPDDADKKSKKAVDSLVQRDILWICQTCPLRLSP